MQEVRKFVATEIIILIRKKYVNAVKFLAKSPRRMCAFIILLAQ